jgi:quinol monooxygenase YgiN
MAGPVVVAVFTAKEGSGVDLEAAIRPIIEATHAEEGNRNYALHVDASNADRYVIVETWRSQADLDAHFGQPYLAGLGDLIGKYLAERPLLIFCHPVPVGDQSKGVL